MLNTDLLTDLLSTNPNEPATKAVVILLRAEMQSEFKLVRSEMNQMESRMMSSMDLIARQVAKLTTDGDCLKSDVSVLKNDVNILKSDVGILKSDVSILKSDVEVLKSDVRTLKNNMHLLIENVSFLNQKMDVILQKLA